MQSREDAPRSRRLASPRGGRRPKRISKPSVSAFFTGPEELKDAAHSAALLAQLKSFYDARLLCDVTIEVVTPGSGPGTGRLFSCNRNVLAAACPYFKSMFTGGMYESQQASVTIHDVDAESFEVLVDYCYTGRVSLSEANVQRLYAASDMLQLEYVREACASFLARRLDLTNCTAILKFADAFDHHKLRSQAQSFIAHNFKQLSRMGSIREETLADLTLAQLLAVLRLDSLDVESEKTVCHVAVQWLEAAPKERGPSAAEVFKCIRWAHFPAEEQDYLGGLLSKPIVKKYCLDIIEGALRQLRFGDRLYKSVVAKPNSSHSSDSNNSSNSSSSSSSVVSVAENPPQRLGMCAKEMVIFFGHPRDPFLCYDPYSGDIYTMPSPLTSLAHTKTITSSAVCVSPDHDIYLAAQPRKDLWVYKPAQNSWHQLADRLLCREGMDVAYLNGYIYILGGRDPITGVKLKEVECYSVQRNQWALVAPVPHSFYSFELIVVQNYLYAVNSKRMLCYDPSHNMWLNCASLKRSDFQEACVFKEEIYCICDIPVMKVYNPARGEWRRISNIPLDSETHNYQIVNHDQKLLLITSTTPQWKKNRVTVYEYDTREDQWINIGTMLGLLQFDSGFICLCDRVYPSCLEPGQSFITEEDDARSESSTEWDLDGFSELDSESGSSSSFSDDEVWVQVAPQRNAPDQ
ncbi:kelch repeat and BTB domain-containing protein 7 [Mus musculus]|uniref:Kelch repeat and BTB (POZ) domain containing 7 n=1 Tax=Mus musculus TaxID=10090 RepID=G5E8C2_MOUSE|nr:kelch repeat and BTB domain-containing protein 7 [Mus musculus]EDL35765.1 mCG9018 [Mus musculus]|eukprot:NP_001019306.2 kelch repeat and BTB domain-containing protein 7 [Mus musculus]